MIERETDNITLCDTSPLQQATDSLQTLLPAVFLALIYLLVPFGLLIKIFFTVPEIEKIVNDDSLKNEVEAPTSPPKVVLTFSNVRWSIDVPRKKKDDPGTGKTFKKEILKGIDGILKPGNLCAIMGPSGCGKSSMLDILADRKTDGEISGTILVNGEKRGRLYKRKSAYVMQNDVLFANLTVKETLLYAAQLRIPNTVPAHQVVKRVKRVLKELDLVGIENSRIGDETTRGISGGQKRRVTVGIELLNDPSILFLDEPTSGLDAYSSLKLVTVLRRLADSGRTVICTIHQPRPDIFELFDMLLLMKAGQVVYFGKITSIRDYFEKLGHSIDKHSNVADIIVDITSQKETEEEEEIWTTVDLLDEDFDDSVVHDESDSIQIEGRVRFQEEESQNKEKKKKQPLSRAYEKSKIKYFYQKEIEKIEKNRSVSTSNQNQEETPDEEKAEKEMHQYANSVWDQIVVLTRRSIKNLQRNRSVLKGLAFNIAGFFFLGIVFLGLLVNFNDSSEVVLTSSKSSFIFLTTQYALLTELDTVGDAFLEKIIFLREYSSGSYSFSSYHISWYLKLISWGIVKGIIYTPFFYFLGGLTITADRFFFFVLEMCIISTLGSSIALLLISLVPSLEAAASAYSSFIGFMITTAGFYLKPYYIPFWFIYSYYMSFDKYILQGLYWNEWGSKEGGLSILCFLQVDSRLNRWENLIVLMVYAPIFHFLAYISTFFHTSFRKTKSAVSDWFRKNQRKHLATATAQESPLVRRKSLRNGAGNMVVTKLT